MTSNDVELIRKMLQMQFKLDKAIMDEHKLDKIDEKNLALAILDKVGKLTHELKSEWCWWKKTQTPVDKKILSELIHIWHFVLSWQNHFNYGEEGIINTCAVVRNSKRILSLLKTKEYSLSENLSDLVAWESCKVENLIAITEYLGFTIEQVYQAYCEKNKVNYQRLKEWY